MVRSLIGTHRALAATLTSAALLVLTTAACYNQTNPEPLEPQGAEAINVELAVTSMMLANFLNELPNPVSANTPPCLTGTQDMSAFPDTASAVGTADKLNDNEGTAYTDGVDPLGDKDGYLLFGHDIFGDNSQASLVNYFSSTTTYCYVYDPTLGYGRVRQYLEDGTEQGDPWSLEDGQ